MSQSKVRYISAGGPVTKTQLAYVHNSTLYKKENTVLVWVSQNDLIRVGDKQDTTEACPTCGKIKSDPHEGRFTDANGRTVSVGDKVSYRFNDQIATLDEALQDGDAYITYEDGTKACVKWINLAKI